MIAAGLFRNLKFGSMKPRINESLDFILQPKSFNLETYNNYASSPHQIFYRLSRKQVATAFYNVLMQADITKGVYCDLSW